MPTTTKYYSNHLLLFYCIMILIIFCSFMDVIHVYRSRLSSQHALPTTALAWQLNDYASRNKYQKRIASYHYSFSSLFCDTCMNSPWTPKKSKRTCSSYLFMLHAQMPHHDESTMIVDLYHANITGGCVKNITNHIRLLDNS